MRGCFEVIARPGTGLQLVYIYTLVLFIFIFSKPHSVGPIARRRNMTAASAATTALTSTRP